MQTQDRPMTFAEQMALVKNIMVLASKIVVPFIRKNVGFRFLNPLHLLGLSLFLFVIGTLSINTPNHESLVIFSGLLLFFGLAQRLRRWIEFKRGEYQHSYYLGDSVFECRWFPKFLTKDRRFPRLFDPLICIIGGFALAGFCEPLGTVIIFSGLSLRCVEAEVHKRDHDRDMDMMDGMITANHHARTVEEYNTPKAKVSHAPQQQPVGIPTGLGEDIERKIRERNARN